ncbi:MAG: transposase [Acidimicrobiales bacterium]
MKEGSEFSYKGEVRCPRSSAWSARPVTCWPCGPEAATPARDASSTPSSTSAWTASRARPETAYHFAGRDLRLIVRRQPKTAGEQLAFDDLGGWRFFALITNIPPLFATAVAVDRHHRLRGGAPEEAIRQLVYDFGIRQLVYDFGMNHAPLQSFMASWLWWLASGLAYNVARWVRVLALPDAFRTCRGKRLRTSFFNVAARVVRTARRLEGTIFSTQARVDRERSRGPSVMRYA